MAWVSLGFNQHDRYLSATPLYFGGGRSFTMGSLFSGATVVCVSTSLRAGRAYCRGRPI